MNKLNSALLIGCGNIGGLYDFDNKNFQSHAKMIYNSDWIKNIDVFDEDPINLKKVASKYNFNLINNLPSKTLKDYDLVCISSPTNTHYYYLKKCLEFNVPLIICEKPISDCLNELEKLEELYNNSKSQVLVNYVRRFNRGYNLLKSEFKDFINDIHTIKIDYHRGLLNNLSHAFDTINYFFDFELNFSNVKILNKTFDHFKKDPTVSLNFCENDIVFNVNGVISQKSILTIEFISQNDRAVLSNSGNDFFYYKGGILISEQKQLLKNYMIDVYKHLFNIYSNNEKSDNFISSLNLNRNLINNIL
jgi:predicted dehydrogenase